MAESIKKNYIYSVGYQVLNIVVPLFTIPYVSRIFAADGIGIYSYTTSIAQYFLLFGMLGLNNYGVREIARVRDNEKQTDRTFSEIWTMQLVTGAIATAVFFLLSILLNNQYSFFFLILLPNVASSMLDVNWYFFGKEYFRITVLRNSAIKILTLFFIFSFIKEKEDLWLYILLHSASIFLSSLALWPILLSEIQIKRPSIRAVIKHIRPNLVMFIPVVAISVYKYMDKIMLGSQYIEEAGYYESVEKILTVVLGLITSLGTVMLPRMSNLIAKNELDKAKRYIIYSLEFVTFLSVPLAFGLMAIAPIFVPLYFGDGYAPCIKIQQFLCFTAIISSWSNVIRTQFLIPYGYDSVYIKSVLSGAIVNFIVNLCLIPHYGAMGAVIGTIAAELVVLTIQNVKAYKEIPIIRTFKQMIPYYFFGVIMFLTISFLFKSSTINFITLVLEIVLGALVYLPLVFTYKYKIIQHHIKNRFV